MNIHYVTSNRAKFDEACKILDLEAFKSKGYVIVHTPLELDELQGTSHEISHHKIMQAYGELKEGCMIDDTSLYCPALGGLPGPYIRPFLEALGDLGLARLVTQQSDTSCIVMCHVAFMKIGAEPLFFEGQLQGKIVMPRGTRIAHKTSWNAIVEPSGEERTFAQMSLEEMSRISARSLALTNFQNFLLAK